MALINGTQNLQFFFINRNKSYSYNCSVANGPTTEQPFRLCSKMMSNPSNILYSLKSKIYLIWNNHFNRNNIHAQIVSISEKGMLFTVFSNFFYFLLFRSQIFDRKYLHYSLRGFADAANTRRNKEWWNPSLMKKLLQRNGIVLVLGLLL